MDNIKSAIERQNYMEAFELLKEYVSLHPIFTDTIAILEASIYMGLDDFQAAFPCIQEGLRYNPANHELYFMLGMVYEAFTKYHKAYLCYENALFYCKDNADDYSAIEEHLKSFIDQTGTTVPKVSIIILNFNQLNHTLNCITTIRKLCPSSAYEIICVDNGSLESPEEWLKAQPDIKYQINHKNLGFAGGCNVGIRLAEPDNDIFLLNNDTLLTENALFWLRMGLYEKEEIGASGAVSNCASNRQAVTENFQSLSECMDYGFTHNIPMDQPLSYRVTLIGFAMLIKRTALNKAGLFDERFYPGNFEDNDYCTRLILNDYKLVVCKNSFIYHFGSAGFSTLEEHSPTENYKSTLETNRNHYIEKWHISPQDSFLWHAELIDLMDLNDKTKAINCLDIGCACGATLLEIQNRYPNAEIYGIESDPCYADFASHIATIAQGNIETMDFPFDVLFDYIFLEDIPERLTNPEQLLAKLRPHLSKQGIIITRHANT